MPHQMPLEKETVDDVYRRLARWCSDKTSSLGNTALAILTGDSELHGQGLRMDEVALTGNLVALKGEARKYCEMVERKLQDGFGGKVDA